MRRSTFLSLVGLLGAAVGGPSLLAASAHAAAVPAPGCTTPKPQVTDVAGDANGINGQAIEPSAPDNMPTPVDIAAADILSVRFATTCSVVHVHKRVIKTVTGFTVTLHLSAAPTPGLFYRVVSSSPNCASLWFEYDANLSATTLRCATSVTGNTSYAIPKVTISGSSIVWTVPRAAMGSDLKVGQTLSGLGAQTRGNAVALVAPQWDDAASSTTWTYGS
ncbi:MAG TPA: hypothetical protein VNE21_07870 [Mycobacteriales bacterium]|nr:hypothetical protein [Mycobacteriales bacterium]